MSNHIGATNKMVSDTPRTDEQINGKPCTRFDILAGDSLRNAAVPSEFARTLERELNAANAIIKQQQLLEEENLRLQERIKRLEEAGDYLCAAAAFMGWHDKIETWNKAKEDKL